MERKILKCTPNKTAEKSAYSEGVEIFMKSFFIFTPKIKFFVAIEKWKVKFQNIASIKAPVFLRIVKGIFFKTRTIDFSRGYPLREQITLVQINSDINTMKGRNYDKN